MYGSLREPLRRRRGASGPDDALPEPAAVPGGRRSGTPVIASTQVLRAMGDPVRWQILVRISQEPELARSVLERVLPLGKGVLSRQTRILAEAGLIDVRRRGRQVFYVLRRDTVDELSGLVEGLVEGTTRADPVADAAPSPCVEARLADVLVLPLGRRPVRPGLDGVR